VIAVDIHAEATSEKVAMGWHLDGRVSVVFGTHTHVPTADERVLPKGTAYITDLGMTGPYDSVLGRDRERVVGTMVSGVPSQFDVATRDVRLCGIVVTVDPATGRAKSVERVRRDLPDEA
jgi:calcineurin-like phosphoesterase